MPFLDMEMIRKAIDRALAESEQRKREMAILERQSQLQGLQLQRQMIMDMLTQASKRTQEERELQLSAQAVGSLAGFPREEAGIPSETIPALGVVPELLGGTGPSFQYPVEEFPIGRPSFPLRPVGISRTELPAVPPRQLGRREFLQKFAREKPGEVATLMKQPLERWEGLLPPKEEEAQKPTERALAAGLVGAKTPDDIRNVIMKNPQMVTSDTLGKALDRLKQMAADEKDEAKRIRAVEGAKEIAEFLGLGLGDVEITVEQVVNIAKEKRQMKETPTEALAGLLFNKVSKDPKLLEAYINNKAGLPVDSLQKRKLDALDKIRADPDKATTIDYEVAEITPPERRKVDDLRKQQVLRIGELQEKVLKAAQDPKAMEKLSDKELSAEIAKYAEATSKIGRIAFLDQPEALASMEAYRDALLKEQAKRMATKKEKEAEKPVEKSTGKKPELAKPKTPTRLPGESVKDYLKRTGQK